MSTPYNPPGIVVLTKDYSLTVGTTAVQAYPQLTQGNLHFLRIFNTHASNTIWCSRAAGVTAAANALSCFSIGPGLYELWVAPGPIPINALSIISTGASTNVTIEIG